MNLILINFFCDYKNSSKPAQFADNTRKNLGSKKKARFD